MPIVNQEQIVNNGPVGMDFGNKVNNNGSTSTNPSDGRLGKAGLEEGGGAAPTSQGGIFGDALSNTPLPTEVPESTASDGTPTVGEIDRRDWRCRISVPPGANTLYRSAGGLMSKLAETDGVIFPHSPTITVTHSANYNNQALTHSNYGNYFYENSRVDTIQIAGEFSAQTAEDASYILAVIYFFRAATKMYYGASGVNQGAPPPRLVLNAYGKHNFPDVPVVVTSFNHSYPNTVDYIRCNDSLDWIPTLSTISVVLQPVYSRTRTKEFNHDSFASGDLISKGFI